MASRGKRIRGLPRHSRRRNGRKSMLMMSSSSSTMMKKPIIRTEVRTWRMISCSECWYLVMYLQKSMLCRL